MSPPSGDTACLSQNTSQAKKETLHEVVIATTGAYRNLPHFGDLAAGAWQHGLMQAMSLL